MNNQILSILTDLLFVNIKILNEINVNIKINNETIKYSRGNSQLQADNSPFIVKLIRFIDNPTVLLKKIKLINKKIWKKNQTR